MVIFDIFIQLNHIHLFSQSLGVFMGLFSKKSDQQKMAENKIDELCGGFLGNDVFKDMLEKNNLNKSTSNVYYKSVLKNEVKNNTLNYDGIEKRLDELMKLDVDALNNKIKNKEDTSLFKTQQDINDFLGVKYTEKHNKSIEKAKMKNLEKERKKVEKEKDNIKKIEDKFNIDLTGKKWFKCSIEEIKYSTFQNQANRNYDYAYVIINNDNVEIIKESVWIKSNMGTRKIFYENITSIDFDARGKLHASSSVIINTKSAEHIQLKFVSEKNYILLNSAFEDYMKKPKETAIISKSSKADDLVKYADLYEKGLISEEEFNKLKNEIIQGESNSNFNEDIGLYNKESNKFCPNCGSEVELDDRFCTSCGNKLN